jgi:flagellar basal body-associated protein FliL
MSPIGMHHFSRVNWNTLNTLDLGDYNSMQIKIKLEIKDANTYPELD